MLGFIYTIYPPYGRLKLSLIPGDPHTGNRRDVPAPPTGSAYQNGSNLVYIEWYGTGKDPGTSNNRRTGNDATPRHD